MQTIGRYEIIEQLGRGSMGTVYKARDPLMDREVAVKTIQAHAAEGAESEEFRKRFLREAKAAGRLAHPGIVTVFDVSVHENLPFLVMEYIPGRTLQAILQSGVRLDLDRVCDIGIQLAEALHYAHENGVIHRDIKPANILVTRDHRTKIADFGVAKLAESSVTLEGQLLGTPAFMAPEQFTGFPIDGRADLFALGGVIYWMATGDKAFAGDTTLSIQYKVVHTDPVPPAKLNPGLPRSFEAVILKGIEKDPAQRYQTGEEFAQELRAWRGREPAAMKPIPLAGSAGGHAAERTELVTVPVAREKTAAGWAPRLTARGRVAAAGVLAALALIAFPYMRRITGQPPAPPIALVAPAAFHSPPPIFETVDSPVVDAPAVASARPMEVTKSAQGVAGSPAKAFQPLEVAGVTMPGYGEGPERTLETSVRPEMPAAAESVLSTTAPPTLTNPAADSPAADKARIAPYNAARLLIASSDVPEPMTVIVSLNQEVFFRRDPILAGAIEDLQKYLQPRRVPTTALIEERPLPPGEHKLRVDILLAARSIGRAQEVNGRFYAGQRRLLQIQFFPAGQPAANSKRDGHRFRVVLK